MADIHLRPLREPDLAQLSTVITGYVTAETYALHKMESETETAVTLKLVPLPAPQTITYDHLDETELAHLTAIVAEGMSVGAFWAGRQVMERVVETAVAHNLRVIVCETQSSNVPAIRAYRKLGFVLDAIDLSFYSNEDVAKESVAVFMKRYVT